MAKAATGKSKAAAKANSPLRMTAAEALTETLIGNGIKTIYGLPGVHNDPLFDAFHGARKAGRLSVVHTRHEQTSAYMALGAALATGKPQTFSVVPGPGFLNASAALLQAYAMNAPVLALLGQIPHGDIDRGFGHLHELRDQLGVASHMTKYTARIRHPGEASALANRAVNEMLSGVPRPAALECAMDVWGRSGPVRIEEALAVTRPPLDEDAVAAAAKLLGSAERPLIVVGGGAQNASAEITALAEALEAPVVAWRRGHGILSARHRLHVNWPIAHKLWKTADAVLAIGTRLHLQQTNWGLDKDLRVVRIEVDPETVERVAKPSVALVGDAKAYAAALLEALPTYNRKRASREAELAPHRNWMAERLSRFEPQLGFLKAMRNALPDDGILVDEVTQLGFAARIAFPVYHPRSYISAGHQDSLGWGIGTALGVKHAMPDRPVLAISGDGGFLYQVGELATAVQHGIGVVFVVFDNGMYGNVRLLQNERYGGRTIASDLKNPDFVSLAESFGMAGHRAKNAAELEKVAERALASGKPALIHVPVAEMPSPWDMIHMPRQRG